MTDTGVTAITANGHAALTTSQSLDRENTLRKLGGPVPLPWASHFFQDNAPVLPLDPPKEQLH